MRKTILTALGAVALLLSANTVQAQGVRGRAGAGPARGADAEARRAFLQEHRGDVKAKWESLTPEQRDAFKAQMKAYQEERKSLMEQVKAGKLDKKTAAEQLKSWREAHKPAKP